MSQLPSSTYYRPLSATFYDSSSQLYPQYIFAKHVSLRGSNVVHDKLNQIDLNRLWVLFLLELLKEFYEVLQESFQSWRLQTLWVS